MGKIDSIRARLAGKRIYIDTNVFIFFLQQNEVYFSAVASIIEDCVNGKIFAMTGRLAIAEVMVHPYRKGIPEAIAACKGFFHQKNFLTIVDHANEDYDTASMLAGQRRMKLIDAMHYLAAMGSDCQFLLTHDHGFKSSDALEVIQLDDLIESTPKTHI